MKRILAVFLLAAMLLPSMFGLVSFAETTESGELTVSAATLQFSSKIYLLVAVDYSELYSDYDSAKEKITVVVTDKQGVKTELKPDDSVALTDGFPQNAVGFKYTDLGAKNMTDQLTIQAYNATAESGAPVTYSVLEYAVKAKSEKADNLALVSALDAMLEFGAEAQKAFNYTGDYALYDENGYIDYGMLIVYGGAQKKVFGKIGSELTPAASADIGANPLLYTTSYDRIAENTVTVEKGVQKVFYISADDKTIFHFDANLITLPEENNDIVFSNDGQTMASAVTTAIDIGTGVTCSLQLNAVAAGKNSVGKFVDLNGERVLEIEAYKGYALTIGSSTATTNSLIGELGDSRYFTLTLTVGLKGSSVLASYFRLRDTSGYPNILNLSEGKISSTTSGEDITTLASEKLSTVHAVFDRTNKTTSYYVDGICVSEESWTNAVNTVLTGTKGSRLFLFGGTSSRAGYIQKIIVTKGNIFE